MDDYKLIADHYGLRNQCMQTQEECAELIQAINKFLRPDQKNLGAAKAHLIEELADVQVMIWQLEYLMKCDCAVMKEICTKVQRQIERMKKE